METANRSKLRRRTGGTTIVGPSTPCRWRARRVGGADLDGAVVAVAARSCTCVCACGRARREAHVIVPLDDERRRQRNSRASTLGLLRQAAGDRAIRSMRPPRPSSRCRRMVRRAASILAASSALNASDRRGRCMRLDRCPLARYVVWAGLAHPSVDRLAGTAATADGRPSVLTVPLAWQRSTSPARIVRRKSAAGGPVNATVDKRSRAAARAEAVLNSAPRYIAVGRDRETQVGSAGLACGGAQRLAVARSHDDVRTPSSWRAETWPPAAQLPGDRASWLCHFQPSI